ncbi:MAG: hypothetical protein IK085_01960 [Clostridia bacterium]|nr:hypothetical protein [Clostridia bacterium]
MIEKSNYEINKFIKLGDGTINGQGIGPVSQMRYGLFPMSYNGCEMIAIYNFLLLEKMENPGLAEIAHEMYPKSGVLLGVFGSNPYQLHKYFDIRNIKVKRFYSLKSFFKQLEFSKFGIISFWNAHHPFHGLHTVCVESIKNGIRVYNRSNKKAVPVDYKNYNEFVDQVRFICGYLFN